MTKTKLETFIKKYYLGGLNTEVRWTSAKGTLKMIELTSDKKLMTSVDLNNFDAFNDAELVVTDTDRLKAMLGPLSDNLTIQLDSGEDDKNRIISMNLSDAEVTQIYKTGDADHLPAKPKLITVPSYDVEIKLSEDFITRFIKSKAALPEVNNFTLIMSKRKKLELVLGYSSNNNTHRSVLNVNCVEGKDTLKTPTSFSAETLKEILVANSDVKDALFKVSEQGLAYVEFVNNDFTSKYYLIKIPVEE